MITITLLAVRIMWLSLKLWVIDVDYHDRAVFEACVNPGKSTVMHGPYAPEVVRPQ